MIKVFCDICNKEIDREKETIGFFKYLERKLDFVKHLPNRVIKEVEIMLCEECTTGARKYFEGQKNIQKV